MSDFFFSKVFPVPFFVAGVVMLVWALLNYLEARESSSWPSVQGRVLSKQVKSSTFRDNNGRTSDSYRPQIEYTYVVDGKTYQGSTLRIPSRPYGRSNKAQEAIAEFSLKKPCTVYFDPEDPNKSVLQPGVYFLNVAGLALFGLGFTVIGIGSFFLIPYAIRQEKAKKKRLAAYQKEREEREKQKELEG